MMVSLTHQIQRVMEGSRNLGRILRSPHERSRGEPGAGGERDAGSGGVVSAVIPTHRGAGFLSVGEAPEAVAS